MRGPLTRSALLLLLAAGGCAFGAGADQNPDDGGFTTTSPATVTGTPTSPTQGRTSFPAADWSPAQLERLLLTASEVGPGFSGGPPTSGSGPSTGSGVPALCPQARYEGPAATVTAQVQYQRSQAGPTVSETLLWFGDNGAQQSVAFFRSVPSVCGSFTADGPQGTVTYRITALSTPTFGDETTAFRISAQTASVPVDVLGDVVLARRGQFVITIVNLNPLRVDGALTRAAVEQAVTKVEEAT